MFEKRGIVCLCEGNSLDLRGLFLLFPGTASMSRAVSSYVDNLANQQVSSFLNSTVPINLPFMAEYADFFSLLIVAIITLLLAFGVKESSYVNMIFTFVNLATVITAFITGAIYCG